MVKLMLRKLGLMPRGEAARRRREGNLNRDAGRWCEAAEAYSAYLQLRPEDVGIWVQQGHVLNEAGRPEDAIDSYRNAVRLAPELSDARNHMLRVLVRTGEETVAIELMLDALSRGISVDASALTTTTERKAREPAQALPAGMTLYSVQDMIGYLHHHATLSGIQRVQAGIARYLIDEASDETGFLLSGGLGGVGPDQFAMIGKPELAAIIDYATGDDVDPLVLRAFLLRCTLSARPVIVGCGHTMIVLGAFWALGSTPRTLWPAKRAGAKIGVYIYDLIPLTHPQFCVPELTRDFCRSLSQMLEFADFFLTISDYTRSVICDLMATRGMVMLPTATVALAHELTRDDTGIGWPGALADLIDAPYVTYVSTIEGRKNHIYIVLIWQRLMLEGVDVPHLIFVGRKGWRNEALYELLESTNYLSGKVRIVHDLDDAELNGIYSKARFSVFTSFVEGWGLPVGESLVHGTPCVASETSSIPEVGESFVDYIDPYDIETGLSVVRRMITEPAYLEGRRKHIREQFQARSWSEVGRTFVSQVERLSERPARKPTPPQIAAGDFVLISPPSNLKDPTWYFSDVSESLVRDDFYDVEHFGAWMKGQGGIVCVRPGLPPGTPVLVYLSVCTSDPSSSGTLTVSVNGRVAGHKPVGSLPTVNHAIGDSLLRFDGETDADGVVSIALDLDCPVGEQSPTDLRQFLIGLRAAGITEIDGSSRSDLLENILLTVQKSNG